MYQRRSRMSGRQQGKLLEHFVAGTTARAAALLVGVQANTAIYFYKRVRQLIASKLPSYELSGEVEADECYFGGVRKGRRGRAAGGKGPVFGLLKRGGSQAKRHLRRFNGIRKESFHWYLKECEWRFNGGSHQRLLRQLKQWYKSSKH